jgi:hypothetical protein
VVIFFLHFLFFFHIEFSPLNAAILPQISKLNPKIPAQQEKKQTKNNRFHQFPIQLEPTSVTIPPLEHFA